MRYFRGQWFTLCFKETSIPKYHQAGLKLLPTADTVPVELIYDGKILYENVTKDTYDEKWLMAELKKRNLVVHDISYAVVGTKGNLYIDLFRDQLD